MIIPELNKNDLEELENDLEEIREDILILLKNPIFSNSEQLKNIRYRIGKWLRLKNCCVCGESPARYTNDAWYCERCVIKNETIY
jgi:hypothetical protein